MVTKKKFTKTKYTKEELQNPELTLDDLGGGDSDNYVSHVIKVLVHSVQDNWYGGWSRDDTTRYFVRKALYIYLSVLEDDKPYEHYEQHLEEGGFNEKNEYEWHNFFEWILISAFAMLEHHEGELDQEHKKFMEHFKEDVHKWDLFTDLYDRLSKGTFKYLLNFACRCKATMRHDECMCVAIHKFMFDKLSENNLLSSTPEMNKTTVFVSKLLENERFKGYSSANIVNKINRIQSNMFDWYRKPIDQWITAECRKAANDVKDKNVTPSVMGHIYDCYKALEADYEEFGGL